MTQESAREAKRVRRRVHQNGFVRALRGEASDLVCRFAVFCHWRLTFLAIAGSVVHDTSTLYIVAKCKRLRAYRYFYLLIF